MSIYKINNNLPISQKIQLLNNMIVELDGRIAQAQFDKNELDSLFDQSGFSGIRMFNRDIYLGNTLGTYSSWAHVKAETGYSIWKFPITDYIHSELNNLYFDDTRFDNRGEANSETNISFDKVFIYDGVYTDVTSESLSDNGTEFECLESINTDFIYLGSSSTFSGLAIELQTRASNVTLKIEYYNGSSWSTLTISDKTNNFRSDGNITWQLPNDWSQSSVNSSTNYWIRISTTTQPITSPKIYLIIPYNSVPAILSLSSEQILSEEWAWCYYNGFIYTTIKNIGNSNYDGDYFITSSSSSTNKQNYFIYNHAFKIDHRNTN